MAELSEEVIGKLIAMAESFQDVKQQVQQAAIDSSQAVQTAKDTAQTIGQLQSDFASRMVVKDDVDVKADERLRAQGADSNSAWAFKTNVYDFGAAAGLLTQKEDTRLHEKSLQAQQLATSQAGIDAYRGLLVGMVKYVSGKWQQELRHSDIATENQWEDPNEIAGNALSGEIAKSVQVPPAATEHKS